jgi:hypothetical protein
MFNNQGTSKPEASQKENGNMAWAFEELEHCEELSEVQLATVVGGAYTGIQGSYTGIQGSYTGIQGSYTGIQGSYTGVRGSYTGVR